MEDVVDFFIPKCQVLGITAEMFGICDDDDKAEKTPAYVSFDNEEKWGAIIKNYSGKPLNISKYKNKRAFACNIRHPNFAYSNMELKQKFYQTNRFRLFDEMTILFR